MTTSTKSASLLLIEDDPGDRNMIERFFEESKIRNEMYSVTDGEEALNYLFQREEYAPPEDPPRPDLILLDLNLPKVDGREVLSEMKDHGELADIPVVVLTSSQEEEDIHRSYNLGANSYIVKPMNMNEFSDMIQSLGEYWFEVVVLPSNNGS